MSKLRISAMALAAMVAAGAAFAVGFLGERLVATSAAGGVFIIVGVAYANWRNGGETCSGLD